MATQSNLIPGSGYGNSYVDSLVWGAGWVGGPVKYSFGAGPVPAIDSSIGAFTGVNWVQAERDAFALALDQYSSVSGLTFELAASPSQANMVWWLASNADFAEFGSGILGMHEVPDGSYPQIYGYYNYQHSTWDNLVPGSYGYITIIHELGHAMGLAHPHDGGDHADATRFPGVSSPSSTGTSGLNQGIWTTMSYNDGWNVVPATTDDFGYQGSLMAFDIAALQALYGANLSTATGDDEYLLPQSNGTGSYWSCIWDAAGEDTLSNAGSSVAGTINLNAAPLTGTSAGGYVSRGFGVQGGYTIANGVVIENAIGGSANDTLIGNSVANTLDGGAGADAMSGGLGDDVYRVDNAGDSVSEGSGAGSDEVFASVTYTIGGNVERLVLTGSSNINGTGNSSANLLTGNSGNNILNGGAGFDTLVGGAGVDRLTGGKGGDIFRFELADTGIGAGQRDVVTDFRGKNGDRIDLSSIDANSVLLGVQDFSYIGSATFAGTAGQLRLAARVLSGDVNGDGLADFEIELTGVRSFNLADLML